MQGGTIEEIVIEGAQRIEPATALSYLGLNPGDEFSPRTLDRAYSSLFSTGLYKDIVFRRQGGTLIVQVVENPLINIVAFEGNSHLDDEELQSEIQSRPRTVFTRSRVQSDTTRLLDVYRSSGRFGATVNPQIIELDQNRVNLVFEIEEGEESEISAINFVGNRAYSDSRLRDELTSSESGLLSFVLGGDSFDAGRIGFDRELLRRFYLSEGYADFEVLSVVSELARNKKDFIVTFTLNEGPQYSFGEVEISTTIPELDPERLRQQVTTIEGETYNVLEVDTTISNLTDAAGEIGFPFAEVQPQVNKNETALTISLRYELIEGPKAFVERIDIEGNVRTVDKVIRREFRLVEGDAFNSSKLARSRQRIQNLGYFRSVEVDTSPGSTPDRVVISTVVEEQSTGSFSVGAGFSTDSGPLGNATISERNLLGLGQDLRLNLTLAGTGSQIDLSYTDPYFLDRPLIAGVDLFRTTQEVQSSAFDEERIGFSLRAGWNYTENFRQVVRYTLDRTDITGVSPTAAAVIRDDEGVNITSGFGETLIYDTRNSRFGPTSGVLASLSTEQTGLGGNTAYLNFQPSVATYVSLFGYEDLTLTIGVEGGAIVSFKPTRVSDRFFIGGATLRGFESGGVGPRDAETQDALGGKYFYSGTFEMAFPLGLPEEFDIRGRVFTDYGSNFAIDGSDGVINDSRKMRATVGAGISWNSPFGPIVIDLATPYLKQSFDKTQVFRFSFGTRF